MYKATFRALCLLALVSVPALTAAQGSILAKKGDITVGASDVRAYHYALDDAKYQGILRDAKQVLQTIDEVMIPRHFKDHPWPLGDMTPVEASLVEILRDRGRLNAALQIADRRARVALQTDTQTLEKRAREMWQINSGKILTPLSADFQHIFFDMGKRPFDETSARILAALGKLKQGASFDDVVVEFSDDTNAAVTKGRLNNIAASATELTLNKALFDTLKIGEYSQPLHSRRGMHIVKLLAKSEPAPIPYEKLKDTLYQRVADDAAGEAREKIMAALRSIPATYDEPAISKLIVVTDPRAFEEAKALDEKLLRERRAMQPSTFVPAPPTPAAEGAAKK